LFWFYQNMYAFYWHPLSNKIRRSSVQIYDVQYPIFQISQWTEFIFLCIISVDIQFARSHTVATIFSAWDLRLPLSFVYLLRSYYIYSSVHIRIGPKRQGSDNGIREKREKYSKPSLIRLHAIRMSDNPDRNLKNAVHSWVHTLKDTRQLGRQMSHLSVETKLYTVSSHLHYYVQKQVQHLGLLSMNKCVVFLQFLNESSTVIFC
jgi:hypothetical protein